MADASPTGSQAAGPAERRANPRLSDLTIPELRRIVLTSALFAVVLALFLWMVRDVIIAAILGAVIAAYLDPMFEWVRERARAPAAAALLTLFVVIVPLLAVVVYSYVEILGVGDYLVTHEREVAREIILKVRSLPWLSDSADVSHAVQRGVRAASSLSRRLPGAVIESAGHFSVAAAIFLFTAFYVLTQRREIGSYARSHIPPRYAELADALRQNVKGVLYGAIFSTFITQTIKSAVVFVLNLIFGVPLAALLAIISFVIGFFPIVGSWSVYVPVAAWLAIFRDNLLGAAVMITVGFLVNTLFFSLYLRPKLAADRSRVLNFYWMFVGLVTGVYTFGIAGLLLGPILIGLLKAIVDTVSTPESWRLLAQEYDTD